MKFIWFSLSPLALVLVAGVFGQQPGSPAPHVSSEQRPPSPVAPASKPEHKITQEQADELFHSVDELMRFASDDTGLPVKTAIHRQLASRDEVQRFLEDHFKDDEDQKRFQRSELVLKKFGLLPRDFDLQPFLVQLLREQVAGFYDPKKKTVYMLDWVDAETQRPVLAHELTHALQDQTIDLDKFMKERKTKNDNEEVANDEASSARTALVEGQGMAVYLDYLLRSSGRTIAQVPNLVEMMRKQMDSGADSSLLSKAPLLLRESLIFPYRDGLGFVEALLAKGGKARAFPQALESPPHDTRDILMPQTYLDHQDVPSASLPEMKNILGDSFEKYDVGAVGQFDVELLIKQFANTSLALDLAPSWRGGAYYAALRKGGKQPYRTGDLALAYIAKWSSPESARRFAEVYINGTRQRYQQMKPVTGATSEWQTEEGEIYIETSGAQVLVMEGFEPALAAKLRKAFAEGPRQHEVAGSGDLSLRALRPLRDMPVTVVFSHPALLQ